MADGKIYITISDTRGGSGAGVSNDNDSGSSKGETGKTLKDFAQHKFFHLVESEARTFVNYSIGNIGNFTGNYQAQKDAQIVVSGVSELINIGSAAITAAAAFGGGAKGVVAAAITVGASVIAKGINLGLGIDVEQFENRRINRNLDIMRNRLGIEGLTNGGRTGNY